MSKNGMTDDDYALALASRWIVGVVCMLGMSLILIGGCIQMSNYWKIRAIEMGVEYEIIPVDSAFEEFKVRLSKTKHD